MRAFGSQGSALDVFSALANAKSLRHLNLYHDSGLTGPLVPPLSPLQGGLCQLARRSLSTLTADGISLTGGIPACLVNNGSSLVELHLGAPFDPDLCRQLTRVKGLGRYSSLATAFGLQA